jgi:pimeloyl-ACP methyl ester carboxylesterase
MGATLFFLHGLESSSRGTKGRWFAEHFPQMILPDFDGSLESRLLKLEALCREKSDLVFVGSSFGGLMATCYAIAHPEKCSRLILLAPALNFPGFTLPSQKILTPTRVIIGKYDSVTPPDKVVPLAKACFEDVTVTLYDDDHMLHRVFYELDWQELLGMGN